MGADAPSYRGGPAGHNGRVGGAAWADRGGAAAGRGRGVHSRRFPPSRPRSHVRLTAAAPDPPPAPTTAGPATARPTTAATVRVATVAGLGEELDAVPFADPVAARGRLAALLDRAGPGAAGVAGAAVGPLLSALAAAPNPDGGLVNFERFARAADGPHGLFADAPAGGDPRAPGGLLAYLAANPRAAEILVRLSAGSQYLTDILIKNPPYLRRLTEHRRLPAYKSRAEFVLEALAAADAQPTPAARLDALRRYQHWELLRIGACDTFGLLDLKSVTAQLSLLADGFTQSCLNLLAREAGADSAGFCVLAFGKLGGEELNYSSDIDLAFLAAGDATRYWGLGQKLIKALSQATGEGFLYRVDMRLRPWGRSGPLVNTPAAHLEYLVKHARPWERQALLKARPIAGDLELGREFLAAAEPMIYSLPAEEVRASVRESKARIEAELKKAGRGWGEVKGGAGSIRDIEFTAQCLQLVYGRDEPGVRAAGTLDALARLADRGYLWADEYRRLTAGYHFLRTVEHALQLRHHRQVHSLPEDPRELAFLARRLDFPTAEEFVKHYENHARAVRAVFEKYVVRGAAGGADAPAEAPAAPHADRMPAGYKETFGEEAIGRHAGLLDGLTDDNPVALRAEPADAGDAAGNAAAGNAAAGGAAAGAAGGPKLTMASFDRPGDFAAVCGLLCADGWDIVAADVFCESALGTDAGRGVITVFDLRPAARPAAGGGPGGGDFTPNWDRFGAELADLLRSIRRGEGRAVRASLAGRVAAAVRPPEPAPHARRTAPASVAPPPPLELTITDGPPEAGPGGGPGGGPAGVKPPTVLHVRAADAPGFLYELTSALALFGIDLRRVAVRTRKGRVSDTLHVTDRRGRPLDDPRRRAELKAAVVLVQQFTHLLPHSPDPTRALTHFGEFLEGLFRRDDWVEEVSRLGRSDVLTALAKVLGVSDFLWHDFLRVQHENLFPVVADPGALDRRPTRERLAADLAEELAKPPGEGEDRAAAERRRLNRFKDRAMFRTDMRHILGKTRAAGAAGFSAFAEELSDVAEVVLDAAVRLAAERLEEKYGVPRLLSASGEPTDARCPVTVCALGKCGGRELGFASDVELMIVYAADGRTAGGREPAITNTEFFGKLVGRLKKLIEARREGIFELDFRLRPYGTAGSPAVRRDTFADYFAPGGPAWPYERQALVKLRPIAGDPTFGRDILRLRDDLLYAGRPADRSAVLAMREKQVRQLVTPGTVNAKLSPGALVDVEYLVQTLQIEHGRDDPELRTPGTLAALAALHTLGHVSDADHDVLREAYGFFRRLINALRVVRGNAKDLTVPPPGTDEFAFLARRLDYETGPGRSGAARLSADLERHADRVRAVTRRHFRLPK